MKTKIFTVDLEFDMPEFIKYMDDFTLYSSKDGCLLDKELEKIKTVND